MTDIIEPIKPIPKDLLRQKVTDAIINYVYQNGLKPGEKLPSERQLAEKLSVGRNSVRMCMDLMEEEALIKRVPGKGSFVQKEISSKSVQMKLMSVDYAELLDIKIWLEQLAIRKAFERATDEQIGELKAIAGKHCELAEKGIFSIEVDRDFHTKLLTCGGSKALTQMVLSLIDSLNIYTRFFDNGANLWLETVPYHLDIVTGLEARELSFSLAAHEYIHHCDVKVLETIIAESATGE